jgi:hypothetical protein
METGPSMWWLPGLLPPLNGYAQNSATDSAGLCARK